MTRLLTDNVIEQESTSGRSFTRLEDGPGSALRVRLYVLSCDWIRVAHLQVAVLRPKQIYSTVPLEGYRSIEVMFVVVLEASIGSSTSMSHAVVDRSPGTTQVMWSAGHYVQSDEGSACCARETHSAYYVANLTSLLRTFWVLHCKDRITELQRHVCRPETAEGTYLHRGYGGRCWSLGTNGCCR